MYLMGLLEILGFKRYKTGQSLPQDAYLVPFGDGYAHLDQFVSEYDATVDALLTTLITLVAKNNITLHKGDTIVETPFSRALKYHITNTGGFIQFLEIMYKNYKIHGAAYARVHYKNNNLLGMMGYERLEVLNPSRVEVVWDETTDSYYYYLDGDTKKPLSKNHIVRITEPVNQIESPRGTKIKGANTKNISEKVDAGLVDAIRKNSRSNYYLSIQNEFVSGIKEQILNNTDGEVNQDVVNKTLETYVDRLKDSYKRYEESGLLIEQPNVAKINQLNGNHSGTHGFNYKEAKTIINESVARQLNIPASFISNARDSDGSALVELTKQEIIPFLAKLSEALTSTILMREELDEGYTLRVSSPEVEALKVERSIPVVQPLIRNGLATVNEIKGRYLGERTVEMGDRYYISADLVEVKDVLALPEPS